MLEVLAVIVLIALIAAVVVTSAAETTDLAKRHEAMASLIDLDHRARLFASESAPAQIAATSERDGAVLTSVDNDEVLAHVAMPRELRVGFQINGQPTARVDFDTRGRSQDYAIVLQMQDRTIVQPVYGMTGWCPPDEAQELDHLYGFLP